jgi:hypothetical protein
VLEQAAEALTRLGFQRAEAIWPPVLDAGGQGPFEITAKWRNPLQSGVSTARQTNYKSRKQKAELLKSK